MTADYWSQYFTAATMLSWLGLRTVEMLVFSPIELDLQLLGEIADGRTESGFCLVDNPFAGLKRGHTVSHAQVMSLITSVAPPSRWKWLARPGRTTDNRLRKIHE